MKNIIFKHLKLKHNFNTSLRLISRQNFVELIKPIPSLLNLKETIDLDEDLEEQDLMYEDECYYFEKEWNQLQQDKIEKRQDYLSRDLNEHQTRECDIIIDKLMHFNQDEWEYFLIDLNKRFNNPFTADMTENSFFDIKKTFHVDLSRDTDNPNYYINQKILQVLFPFISSGYFSGGAGAASAATKIEKKEESTKEVKKETVLSDNTRVNIKLASFDAAKKIALIKEVRGFLNLGLKEAKELVEKAPVSLGAMIKVDADPIVKKLQENGAVIELTAA